MRKLNMWHRLGIVLSLVWIVGAGAWQRNSDFQVADILSFETYQNCKDKPNPVPAPGDMTVIDQCGTDVQRAYDSYMANSWARIADFTIVPVFMAWLLVYSVLWIAKWVLAGRRISN